MFHIFVGELLDAMHQQELLFLANSIVVGAALAIDFVSPQRYSVVKTLVLLAEGWKLVGVFPDNSNHSLVEFLILVAFVLSDIDRPEQRRSLMEFLRWLGVYTMLFSGLRKLLSGTYFQGTFLASRMHEERFFIFFRPLLDSNEMTHLHTLLLENSAGPFRFESPFAILVSNSVWLSELVAGIMLIFARTRTSGAILAVLVLVGIEVIARELVFGFLALNIYSLFFPEMWVRRLVLLSCFSYLMMVGVQLYIGGGVRVFN